MKPMIIIPPGQMSQADIKQLHENGICVVVARNPEKVKFVDPIPAAGNRDKIENAAIQLSRTLLNKTWGNFTTNGLIGHDTFSAIFIKALIEGTALDSRPSKAETEKQVYDNAHWDEVRKIAREDARRERDAKKAVPAKTDATISK